MGLLVKGAKALEKGIDKLGEFFAQDQDDKGERSRKSKKPNPRIKFP